MYKLTPHQYQAGSPKRPGRDSTGILLLVFFSEMTSVGQFTAHTPHPMQKFRSIIILSPFSPSSRLITSRGHISTQVSHRVHSSWAITGSKFVLANPPLYPKSLIDCSDPQQHEQQFQMKDDGFCIFNVECTNPASAALLNTSITSS